ncbi:MAG: TIM barrel protein [Clostridia bacterium]|nr:TIM barrel protein [Clostridia bacterium]
MIDFGPSGRCEMMEENGLDIMKVPAFLHEKGLMAFEYPLTYGINISREKAKQIGDEFKKYNIKLSVHAPYYINLASPTEEGAEKSFGYIISSIVIMKAMGADRLVFHPGSLTKQTREVAFLNTLKRLKELVLRLKEDNLLDGIFLCPETMGKHGQIGTYEEVLEMCKIDEHIIPTLDFGHINAFTLGGIKTSADYEKILNAYILGLGERGHNIHSHFSRIKYGDKGEICHLNFDSEEEFGPDYKELAKALKNCKTEGRIISESRGHQTIDSLAIKAEYEKK